MNRVHLLCNAHLDPVWLWEWEEGAAEALSTFRTAADFCETYEGFVFNHNEAVLYQWVEEYEPELFARIQRLVAAGRWHIMGGWFLQPDCNMPSGEALVRQILAGRAYFDQKFGARPRTAINFDSFGHSRGLVQILKKAGYDSYVFCRPVQADCPLPADDFVWSGFDGSTIVAHRSSEHYLSLRGQAVEKVTRWIAEHEDQRCGLVLWGIGNHGGGPSRVDLDGLQQLMASQRDVHIRHSAPEAYFDELAALGADGGVTVRHDDQINYVGIGCYTSQVRIKQTYRRLENELFATEKTCAAAAMNGLAPYPRDELAQAQRDLLFAQFHDILPGSSIPKVEESALRLMSHGLEILTRLKARAFFALCRGQQKAADGEIPILIHNPHPFAVQGIFECEFQLPDQNWQDTFSSPSVFQDGSELPTQTEQEQSYLNLDWRKRVVFAAELQPGQVNRFDCRIAVLPAKLQPAIRPENDKITFKSERLEVVINCATGLLDRYRVDGIDYLGEGAFQPLVIEDGDDTWAFSVREFRRIIGRFSLMSPADGTAFSGVRGAVLDSVRVIEDGAVQTVVEALLSYEHSVICLHYKLPKHDTEIEIAVRVLWNEKGRILKLSVPTLIPAPRYFGQVAYGVQEQPTDGHEVVAQKWVGVFAADQGMGLTCINEGAYGSDFCGGELRLSLLRSPGYAAHPILDRPIMPQDRFSPRIDQGERSFTFWMNAGPGKERRERVDREALAHNERPFALSFFPSGAGDPPRPAVQLSDGVVQMTAFKKAEKSEDYIIRVFEPTGAPRSTTLEVVPLNMRQEIQLSGFEIKTFRVDPVSRSFTEVDLLEALPLEDKEV